VSIEFHYTRSDTVTLSEAKYLFHSLDSLLRRCLAQHRHSNSFRSEWQVT